MDIEDPTADAKDAAPVTILVADDDPVMRTLTAEVLRRAGYVVVEAADGTQALEMARSRPPDALIIDLLMPGLSGTQVLRELRTRQAFRRIPAIMVSGIDDVGYRVQALSAGANDFLVKPVAPDEIVARMAAQLRMSSAVASDFAPAQAPTPASAEPLRCPSCGGAAARGRWPVVDMRTGRRVVDDVADRFDDAIAADEVRPDVVRIDASVVRSLGVDRSRQGLVDGYVRLAATNGWMIVALGVAQEAERRALVSLGVHFGQGPLLDGLQVWSAPDPALRHPSADELAASSL